MLAVYDVCRVEKTDDKYLKIMSSVPNAEKYDLFTVDNVLFVPLDQVYDLMKVQPDPDTVSRKAVISAINNLHDKPNAWLDNAVEAVKELPPSPSRPHGQWIRVPVANGLDKYRCDKCGHYVTSGEDKNFCPNCGNAKTRSFLH